MRVGSFQVPSRDPLGNMNLQCGGLHQRDEIAEGLYGDHVMILARHGAAQWRKFDVGGDVLLKERFAGYPFWVHAPAKARDRQCAV